jgi:hypothetical protein
MGSIFLVFHVSQLKKCLRVSKKRIKPQGIRIKSDLEYYEQPVQFLATKLRIKWWKHIRYSGVIMMMVTWHGKRENICKTLIKTFITNGSQLKISGRDSYKGEGCNTLGVKHCISIANHDHEHHFAFIITCNISITLSWNMWNITLKHECCTCLFKYNFALIMFARPIKHVWL